MWRVRERWSSGLPVGEAWIRKLQDLAMYIVWLQEFQVSSFSVQTTRDFTKPFDKPSKRGYSKSRLIGVVQGWFRISAAGLIGTGVSTSKVCCYKPLYSFEPTPLSALKKSLFQDWTLLGNRASERWFGTRH